ncbi:Major facilitator superfamily general substrate transporter [Cordyceps militaris]|uniref:Major facilitator superfamily general substrate transporter n=1 Tax=Cordyceps militaris TaxID=73501 RepID=A0A2H4SVW8_CORMI|nr:Major facilitator superfamily general substrate transporter [Cordyceps militaris]
MESAPLLGNAPSSEIGHGCATRLDPFKQHFHKWRTFYICALFLIVTDVPSFMGEGPMLRMLELGACREYYAIHDPDSIDSHGNVPERLCKLSDIQSRVARVRSLLAFLEAVPGLLLAVPYGIVADTHGRGLVVGLCLAGFLVRDTWVFICLYFYKVFPLNAVYLAPMTAILGGGSTVTGPMLFAMIAASTARESRSLQHFPSQIRSFLTPDLRAHAFFMIQVCLLALESISPPLGSLLMETVGPYYAWLAGIPLGLLGFACLSFLPRNKTFAITECEPCAPEDAEHSASSTTMYDRSKERVTALAYHLRHDIPKLFHSKSLFVGLLAMFTAKMARPIKDLLSQFMTAKFEWPISQANLLISVHAAAQLPWFIAVLPTANAWLLRWQGDAVKANHVLATLLVSCLTLGAIFMGLAPTSVTFIIAVIVYTGGSGFSVAMRSLLTALVTDDQLSLLFTTIAVFEASALLTAAPLLQFLFAKGLQYGGLMISLPFFTVAVFYGCATMALSLCTFK